MTDRVTTRNAELLARAEALMPGGVSSPVRAYRAVGGRPPFIVAGEGCRVRDAEGRTYVDLVCSWGPLIAGHAHPAVVRALEEQARLGTSYGAPTPLEVELAETIAEAMPGVEMLRFVSSGTEAVMSAVRLARAATGRSAILKFAGCYHGHADALLAKAGSGLATLGLPGSAGVTRATAADTMTVAYNDLPAVEAIAAATPLAAVVVEPYAGNMGCVPPDLGFLEGLRHVCDQSGALLVFDEVITGFRVARGGAQERTGVRADLTCLGKVIGGGLPVGAYGGSRALMSQVAPLGPVYQAGTLSGNPLAMAAGLATLRLLDGAAYERLETLGARLETGLAEAITATRAIARVQRVASLLTLFFTDRRVRNEDDAMASDRERFAAFHRAMLGRGVMLPPSQFECWFLSLAHDEAAIDEIVAAAHASLEELTERGSGSWKDGRMNELYRYITLAVTPEWRRLPAHERAAQKRDFAEAATAPGGRVQAYSLVGTRSDADLLLWVVADGLEPIRELETRLAGTRLWTYSTRPYGYLAARRRSPYLGEHAHQDSEHAGGEAGPVGDKAYLVVYPMVKKRSWYALAHEERTRIMAKHFEVGHRYPEVRIHTGYSFGIDDQEFVVAFEVDDVRRFVALVADLRETEASSYTERETPIFVGAAMPLERALDQIDGTAARVEAFA